MFIIPMSNLPSISTVGDKNAASPATESSGFSSIFSSALQNAREAQAVADQDSVNLSLGNADNLAQIMVNSAKASTAVSVAVDLTSRAVSSYKEIMQMQI